MRIIAEKISTKYFHYDKEDKVFSTECSSLPRTFNPESRIYDDACDCGFILVSEKTNNEVLFIFDKEDRSNDEDKELMGTWFKYCGANKSFKDLRVLIIND